MNNGNRFHEVHAERKGYLSSNKIAKGKWENEVENKNINSIGSIITYRHNYGWPGVRDHIQLQRFQHWCLSHC